MNIHRQMVRDFRAFREKLLASAARYERKDAVAEIKKILEEGNKAFDEFKKAHAELEAEVKKLGAARPETEAKLTKIEAAMNGFEALNQKITLVEAQQKAIKSIEDQVDAILTKLNRPPVGGDPVERKAYFENWCRGVVNAHLTGVPNLPDDQRKALDRAAGEHKALGNLPDTAGGYLAPVEFVREIIKGEVEVSPVRSLVRVRQTVMKSIQVPKRTGTFSAVWVAEQGTRTETTGLAYGLVEIPAHEVYALIDISQQNLEDSAFDMEAEIRTESVEQFAVAEGTKVVKGDGVGTPQGFLEHPDVASTNSGAAATVTADGLINVKHAIKTAYTRNASWVMNRTTLGAVRRLKDGNGQYLWMPGLAQGKPNTIDGDPYVELPDMPNEAANAFPVAYGDFRRAYTLVDRITMAMLRDPYTQATSGNIRFILRRRLGGQIVLAEAIRLLKCAV